MVPAWQPEASSGMLSFWTSCACARAARQPGPCPCIQPHLLRHNLLFHHVFTLPALLLIHPFQMSDFWAPQH